MTLLEWLQRSTLKWGDDYKTLRFLAQPDGDFLYIGPERFNIEEIDER